MKWQPTEEPPDDERLACYRSAPESDEGRRSAGALLGRYRGRVYGWCLRMMGQHEDALDLAQAVLLKAWRALPGFDRRSQFSSWLFAITRNECLSALRPRSLRGDPGVDPAKILVDHDDPQMVLETRRAAQ